MFPWAITATDGLLIRAAADAASRATVPIAIHLDHCQDEALVRLAADTLPFDSIMVDMSHHEKAENLAKTKELVAYCHADHAASARVLEKCAFRRTGVLHGVCRFPNLAQPEAAAARYELAFE